jgi:ATPase subunit of ABC transporter with duplicated ATPase domains
MALLSLQNLHIAFGGPKLLDGVTLQIEPGERICLVGRNGQGKSTLLKIVSGELEPDKGEIVRSREVRIARLQQTVPQDIQGTVFDLVSKDWNHEHALDHPVEKAISLCWVSIQSRNSPRCPAGCAAARCWPRRWSTSRIY